MHALLFLSLFLVSNASSANPVPMGYPNRGSLEAGANLSSLIKEHSDLLSSVSPPEFQYGTDQMAKALVDIGTWGAGIQRQPVWIGDISKKGGEKLARHVTHQRGLDVDIAYLVHQHKRTGHRARRFHDRFTEQFGLKGKLGPNFDLEWNYQLLRKIIGSMDVESIYVGCTIYDAMETLDSKQPSSIMKQIYGQKGHEDHFHLRLKCPTGVSACSNSWWEDPSARKKEKSRVAKSTEKYREC